MTLEHYGDDNSLGRPKDWPIPLKMSLANMFGSAEAQCLLWGIEQFFFYNDAFALLFSEVLACFPYCGSPIEHWPEQWGDFPQDVGEVLRDNKTIRRLDCPFHAGEVYHHLQYFTYSASPLFDAEGEGKGCLLNFTETTSYIIRERRLRALHELASETAYAKSPSLVLTKAVEVLKLNREDFSFILILAPQSGEIWSLREWSGIDGEPVQKECRLEGEWSRKRMRGLDQGKILFSFFQDPVITAETYFVKLCAEVGNETACIGFGLAPHHASNFSDEYEQFILQASRCIESSLRGAEAFVKNYGEQVSYREQLEQSQAKLEAAVQAANEANRLKTSFLADMSHEIRTPLSAILGYSELLQEANLDDVEAEYLSVINRNGQALTRLVDDILDLSKVEAGKLSIDLKAFSLSDLVSEVLSLFERKATLKGLFLKARIHPDVPKAIVSDRARVRQILINVIGNALKFTQQGGVDIEVLAKDPAELDKIKLHIQVSDTGVGLDEKQRDELFHPFVQLDHTIAGNYGGTGLGLTLSRRLARALGGDLTIEDSALGKGCIFVIAFTAAIAPDYVSNHGLMEPLSGSVPGSLRGGQLKGLRILVVDDSPDNRFLLTRMLRYQGAEIIEAADGQEAVELAMNEYFDVVLMDIQMPRLDGFGALASLRSRNFNKPILALTAHAMKEEREKMLKAGFNGHVAKPVNQRLLFENIVQVLQLPTGSSI